MILEWNKISDKLPAMNQDVLLRHICFEQEMAGIKMKMGGEFTVLRLTTSGMFYPGGIHPCWFSHWAPLPEKGSDLL